MGVIHKMRIMDSYAPITVASKPAAFSAVATAGFWSAQDQQKSRSNKHFLLAALALHLALAVLFLIELKAQPPVPEELAVELVSPPAQPPIKPAEPKSEVRETPKPQPVQQRAIPKPMPHLDPPHPAAIAVAPALPSPPQATSAPPAPEAAPAAQTAPPPTYLAELYAHLARYKHYPRAAQLAHIQGTAYLRFTMNRQGKVLSYKIEQGSGHVDLDEEVLAMIERAQPLPVPPADMPDITELVIPVQFSVR